jgi:hypothetical protein
MLLHFLFAVKRIFCGLEMLVAVRWQYGKTGIGIAFLFSAAGGAEKSNASKKEGRIVAASMLRCFSCAVLFGDKEDVIGLLPNIGRPMYALVDLGVVPEYISKFIRSQRFLIVDRTLLGQSPDLDWQR